MSGVRRPGWYAASGVDAGTYEPAHHVRRVVRLAVAEGATRAEAEEAARAAGLAGSIVERVPPEHAGGGTEG